jgi:hypothetical protein
MGSRGVGLGINQVIEKAGNEGIKRLVLGLEELGFGLASLPALRRVAVIGVVRDGDIFACRFEFIGQGFRFKTGLLVIDEVLQVVGIAAFLGQTWVLSY